MVWLPDRLPARANILWRAPLPGKGLGGIAATSDVVLVSAREAMDTTDAYLCLDAATGKERWRHLNPAPADKELDYGNSPRATPLLHGKQAFLAGAFGHLHCVEIATGKVVWEKDLRDEFGATDERKWGHCSSPLLADGRLIVNPGGKKASLVALEPTTGKVLWQTPGAPASYGNLIAATLGGRQQVVGFDSESLGGWDLATGKRLWRIVPPRPSDFNVPTPLAVAGQLLVAWENNGTLLFRFGKDGIVEAKPVATYPRLAPDMHTPVAVASRVFGAWNGLHCLDLRRDLAPIWVRRDVASGRYLTLIASDTRVLAITMTGELMLFDAQADEFRLLGKLPVFADENGMYAHAALVGRRLYLRGERELVCLDLGS
ncbi:MAG: PQQ-binding-like beta-propeller repeat protein [Gemmataceae bacterium]